MRARRFRLSGALLLCAFLASEIAFLGFPRPLKSPDAPSANVVSKIAEAPQSSVANIEERIEEHVSIPEILKRYGLPALFFHFWSGLAPLQRATYFCPSTPVSLSYSRRSFSKGSVAEAR